MIRLFVYGTLKRNSSANDLIRGHYIGEFTTHPRYHLYRIGSFPGMVVGNDESGGVKGEVFEISQKCLASIDHYEGIPYLFRREEIELADGSKAWAYLYNQPIRYPRIEEGVWE